MLDTYLASIVSPMNRAKAKAALTTQVRVNGAGFHFRHEVVEMRVREGAKVIDRRGDIVLMSENGAFFDVRNITKHGLNYAAWLSVQAAGAGASRT